MKLKDYKFHNKKGIIFFFLFLFFIFFVFTIYIGGIPIESISSTIELNEKDIKAISKKIFINETKGDVSKLLSWNKGENFLSLGIGHFIWYPKDSKGRFTESFPPLIEFFNQQNFEIPKWLATNSFCPWSNYKDFSDGYHSKKKKDLHQLLTKSYDLQALFLINRLKDAIPKIISLSSDKKRVEKNFFLLSNSPNGVYAMVDYVNFKGEGISNSEKYNGQGWGLLQVLEIDDFNIEKPVESFMIAASEVLSQRVENSKYKKREAKWLIGWKKRIFSYNDNIYE